jgi:NADH-quinone oxidoreductase subunit C
LHVAALDLHEWCHALRDEADFKFAQLMDICVVDYLTYGVGAWATSTATSQGFSRATDPVNAHELAAEKTSNNQRFAAVYHLLSVAKNQRIRLKCFTEGEPPCVPSVIDIWPAADWYEREAFDLFGVVFVGHPDLRRLLTDYGFIGHPFRKDFPLIGQVEMRYDATEQRVVYEPVSIKERTLVPKVIRYVGHSTIEET